MNDDSGQYEPADLPVRETFLPEGLVIVDIETSLEGRITGDTAMTLFIPQGYATPTWVHLQYNEEQDYTLIVHPLTGRTEIHDERVEMQR